MRSLDSSSARALLAASAALFALAGCGGSPSAPARDDVFYVHGSGAAGMIDKNYSWEVYFKPLDATATERLPRMVGVGVLNGDVRMSRPMDWYIRGASYSPGSRYISYQSPRQFLFSIFERIDSPEDPWADVLKRYEADVDEQGGKILAGRIPVATANAQGRSYFLKSKVPGKPEYQNYAHEILVRSNRRVLLVQIIHGENLEPIADEVVAALNSMIVY